MKRRIEGLKEKLSFCGELSFSPDSFIFRVYNQMDIGGGEEEVGKMGTPSR